VIDDANRVLIVMNGHDAALLSLYDYFTFRGLRVDCAKRMDDARALVRHVYYHAVIVSTDRSLRRSFAELLNDVRSYNAGSRVLAVVRDGDESELDVQGVSGVFSRDVPISQLARVLRYAMTKPPEDR
jgi:hypothetical protein